MSVAEHLRMPPDPNMTGAELILEARIDPFDSRALAVAPRFGKHIANRAPRLRFALHRLFVRPSGGG